MEQEPTNSQQSRWCGVRHVAQTTPGVRIGSPQTLQTGGPASSLEAGVPCREVRVERVGDGQIALLLRASDREQWLMHVVAHARRAAWN